MIDIIKLIDVIQNKLNINCYHFDANLYNNYVNLVYSWYKGDVPTFHNFSEYNGHEVLYQKKNSLNMAKRVCEDISSLTCNENINIIMDPSPESEYLLGTDGMTGILGNCDFWSQLATMYELTCALGTGAFEVLVDGLIDLNGGVVASTDKTKIKIINHNAFNIIPLSWDSNRNIREVCFVDSYKIKNNVFVDLRLHILENGVYHIINKRLQYVNNISYVVLNNLPDGVIEDFNTGSDIPWFSIIKLPIVLSQDIGSPLGASVYGSHCAVLQCIDEAFNDLCIELKRGSKKTFIDRSMLERDSSGNLIYPSSNNANRLDWIYVGDGLNSNTEKYIQEFNPTLRIEQLTNALRESVNIFASMCGLGDNFYKFTATSGITKTATEVVSEQSDLYRNIRKLEIGLNKNMLMLFRSLLYASNYILHTDYDINIPIRIEFDTSIVTDETAERNRALQEVQLGLMSVDEYRNRYLSDMVQSEDNNNNNNVSEDTEP